MLFATKQCQTFSIRQSSCNNLQYFSQHFLMLLIRIPVINIF